MPTITLGGISTELYEPVGTTPRGIVIIAYGLDGFTDHLTGPWKTMMHGYADHLASAGFAAVIPEYFQATGTVPGPALLAQMAQPGQMIALRDAWQKALSDAIGHAQALPLVDRTRTGFLGFSFGGHLCLRLRARAKVVISYFAPFLDGIGPSGPLIKHVELHHGTADLLPGTGYPNAGQINQQLVTEGTATVLCSYPGAGHGFIGGDADNKTARELSQERTLAFFKSHL
jgi:dienelactone hydrolase